MTLWMNENVNNTMNEYDCMIPCMILNDTMNLTVNDTMNECDCE